MRPEEIAELKSIFSQVLEERRSIDSETHRKDHDFLHIMMEREVRKSELIESTKKQVLGWGMILLMGFIGYSLLEHIKNLLLKFIH